jgi:hypothetical protein
MSLLLFAVIRLEVVTPDLSKAIVVERSDGAQGTQGLSRSERAAIEKEIADDTTEGFEITVDKDLNIVLRGAARTFLTKELQRRVVRAKQVVYGGAWRGRVLRSLAVIVVYGIVLIVATVALVLVAILLR